MRFLAIILFSLTSLSAWADSAQLSLLAVTCPVPGAGINRTIVIGTSAADIQTVGTIVKVAGLDVTYTNGTPKDSDEEYGFIGKGNYKFGEVNSISCGSDAIGFRLLGHEQRMNMATLFEVLPFQSKCIDGDQAYKTCPDQREVYKANLKLAAGQGKMLLVAYGYSGCAWCDSLDRILNYSDDGANARKEFVIQEMAVSRATNRTARELSKTLEGMIQAGDQVTPETGVPLIFIINPRNGKVAALDLEPFELDYDYVRSLLVARIDALAKEIEK